MRRTRLQEAMLRAGAAHTIMAAALMEAGDEKGAAQAWGLAGACWMLSRPETWVARG